MDTFICSVCGYTHEGNIPPEKCPICKSASSQFTILNNNSKDDAQNIDDSITTKGDDCESESSIIEPTNNPEVTTNSIDEIKSNDEDIIMVKNPNEQNITEDEKEILKFGPAKLQAVKWYKEKYDCGLKEAKDYVDSVYVKHGLQSANKGCIITILIVITSTISVFCLI